MENAIKAAVLGIFLFCNIATAQAFDFYLSGNAGIAMPDDSTVTNSTLPGVQLDYGFDNNVAFAGAVGLVEGSYRSEAEFSYQKNDLSSLGASGLTVDPSAAGVSGNNRILSGLMNAYYDFDLGNRVHPYITAGVGFSKIKASFSVEGFSNLTFKYKDTILAYQVGGGLGYDLTDRLTLDLRYRFMTGQDAEFPEFGGTTKASIRSHNFLAGLRYRF